MGLGLARNVDQRLEGGTHSVSQLQQTPMLTGSSAVLPATAHQLADRHALAMRQQVRDKGGQIEAAAGAGRKRAGYFEIASGPGTEDVCLWRVVTGRASVDEGQLEHELLDCGKPILQAGRAHICPSARFALVLIRVDLLVNHRSPCLRMHTAPTQVAPLEESGAAATPTAYADLRTRQLVEGSSDQVLVRASLGPLSRSCDAHTFAPG